MPQPATFRSLAENADYAAVFPACSPERLEARFGAAAQRLAVEDIRAHYAVADPPQAVRAIDHVAGDAALSRVLILRGCGPRHCGVERPCECCLGCPSVRGHVIADKLFDLATEMVLST